jgi:ATP-dependent Lon protease
MYTIPLGGIKDSSYLLGHNYTYVESNYGEIVKGLIKTQVMNPIFYFDELDKVAESNNGKELYSILTFMTDPSQNTYFKDHYFGSNDITFDLSKSFFIFTFNDISKIDSVLLDRINLINVSDYSTLDKKIILRDYNLQNILININKNLININFEDTCFDYILNTHPGLSLREYIFILERIIMEINKLIFLEKRNILDFFDIDIELFKTIYRNIDVKNKKKDIFYSSLYL